MSSTSHMSEAARSLEAEEYRRTSFEIWEAMAAGWNAGGRSSRRG